MNQLSIFNMEKTFTYLNALIKQQTSQTLGFIYCNNSYSIQFTAATRVIFNWLSLSQPKDFETFGVAAGKGLMSVPQTRETPMVGVAHVQHPSLPP